MNAPGKRSREDVQEVQSKLNDSAPSAARSSFFADQVELGELLEHDRDSTEAMATGSDETAEWAYGGDYFYAQQESQGEGRHPREATHHGKDGAANSGEIDKGRQIFVNQTLKPPQFFYMGHDFPAMEVTTTTTAHKLDAHRGEQQGEEEEARDVLLHEALHTDMDIIVPVVSADCSFAVSASKGSPSLLELKRLMDRERTNRAVMDTSQSSLTQLLKKDVVGRVTEDGGHHANRENEQGSSMMPEDGEDEAEVLRRQLRLEKEKMQAHGVPKGGSSVPSSSSPAVAADQEKGGTHAARKQRKEAQLADIEASKADLRDAETDPAEAARQRRMEAQKQSLPIYQCRSELLRYIGENPVTVVVGETGSGKTTQLVQYLHERGYARHGQLIGCTQPRRLAAMGVARRVSEEMHCVLGSTVGYSIHLDDRTSPETELKFMTDGVLLRETVNDPLLDKYSVIVLDEAHERSVDTDVLMGVLKMAIQRRGDLKLIVTSATMDIQKFSRFFGNAPHYEIPGQTFPVSLQYSPSPVADYVAEAVFRVCQLHLQKPLEGKHDILVFMTGREDVYGTCELIRRRMEELSPAHLQSLLIMPCLSEAAGQASAGLIGGGGAADRYPHVGVLDPTPPGIRKVVVATNVAETSLTLDGVRYVIDCGYMKTNVYRPAIGMNTLQRYPTSQAQAGQRKGRAGRTTDGVCYRLYTEEQFTQEMLPNSVPEIQRSSVDSVVLLLKSIGVTKLQEFAFMDAPPVANVRHSMFHLWVLGFLDGSGGITAEGRQALEFPMSPVLAKLLLESATHGCSVEMLKVVSMISADPKNLFELPKSREKIAHQHHSRFYSNDSDHLTLLNVFTQYMDHGMSMQWARDHFLHPATLARAVDVHTQLVERMKRLKLPLASCGPAGVDRVRYCLAKGFALQAAQRSERKWTDYRPLLNAGVTCAVHPSSSITARSEMPPYIIYNDLLLTQKEYMVMVTAVEPEWLVEGARGIYKMRGMAPTATTGWHTSAESAGDVAAVERKLPKEKEKKEDEEEEVDGPMPPPRQAPAAPAATKGKFPFAMGKRRQNI